MELCPAARPGGQALASLVPAPLHRGMTEGKIVRFEEITRCPLEIQDVLLSVLSDRVMSVPELDGEGRSAVCEGGIQRDRHGEHPRPGGQRDERGFEAAVQFRDGPTRSPTSPRRWPSSSASPTGCFARAEVPVLDPKPDITELLVTTFHELRAGKTADGRALEPLTTALSTAEAVSAGYASGIHAYYYGDGVVEPGHLVQHLVGSALKDAPDDLVKIRHYFNHVVKDRSRRCLEGLLRGPEAAVMSEPDQLDLAEADARVVFVPVRHHSPACARVVVELAERMRPDAILIEGPSDFNNRIDELTLGHHLPIAIYSYVRMSNGSRCGAYYPFCVYSPEWQAIESGRKKLGAVVRFIDLPFRRRRPAPIACPQRYADAEMKGGTYVNLLCRRLGVDDFDALWDDLFEVDPNRRPPRSYLERGHAFCGHLRRLDGAVPRSVDLLSRSLHGRADSPGDESNSPAESWSLTGGFHSPALA